MPRTTRKEPPPLESFTINVNNEDIICEVRDGSCKLVYRGSHKRDEYEDKLWSVMEKVVDDYLTPQGRKIIRIKNNDYLGNVKKFVTKVELWGYGAKDGGDDSALRKKLYKDVIKQLAIFENAIKARQEEKN